MGTKTGIEWTDSTWNPVTGCSKVSPGCDHCYAERISLRFGRSKKPWTPENAAENVVLHPDRLREPLHWRGRKRVFVNSMSDLFHDRVPFEFIDQVFEVMAEAKAHQFQILTKRPMRMIEWLRETKTLGGGDFLPNVWFGVSVESQQYAWRARAIARDPDLSVWPVRFVSAEPLIAAVSLKEALGPHGINWVIVGGESGIGARPMDPSWATTIRDECSAAGVPFFFKQWGGPMDARGHEKAVLDGRRWVEFPTPST